MVSCNTSFLFKENTIQSYIMLIQVHVALPLDLPSTSYDNCVNPCLFFSFLFVYKPPFPPPKKNPAESHQKHQSHSINHSAQWLHHQQSNRPWYGVELLRCSPETSVGDPQRSDGILPHQATSQVSFAACRFEDIEVTPHSTRDVGDSRTKQPSTAWSNNFRCKITCSKPAQQTSLIFPASSDGDFFERLLLCLIHGTFACSQGQLCLSLNSYQR